MSQRKRLILPIAFLTSIAFCALVLLQSAGIVPPVGVSWGDGRVGRAYAVVVDASIYFQTLSGVKNFPPGSGGHEISSTGQRTDVLGFHYHRENLVLLETDRKPLPGI